MTTEEIAEYEWDKFCRRYPASTNKTFTARLIRFVFHKDCIDQKDIWINGFLVGQLTAHKE